MPPKLAPDELGKKGWNTISKMADLAKGLSSSELVGYIDEYPAGFIENFKTGQRIKWKFELKRNSQQAFHEYRY